MYATYCSLSRISDNKHHPTDVVAGIILGLTHALGILYFYVSGRRDGAKYTVSDSKRVSVEMESKVP